MSGGSLDLYVVVRQLKRFCGFDSRRPRRVYQGRAFLLRRSFMALSILVALSRAAKVNVNGVIRGSYRLEATASSVGPFVTLHVKWPQVECSEGENAKHEVLFERDQYELMVKTTGTNITLEYTDDFPVLFFHEYFIMLSATCGENPRVAVWSLRFRTGAGEPLPVTNLRGVQQNSSIDVQWELPLGLMDFCQNEGFRVDISVCGRTSLSCDLRSFPLCAQSSVQFKMPNPVLRQIYDVRARVRVGTYRSKEISNASEPDDLVEETFTSVSRGFQIGFLLAYGAWLVVLVTFGIIARWRV